MTRRARWIASVAVCVLLAAAGACRRGASGASGSSSVSSANGSSESTEAPPRVPFEVRRDSSDLVFFWFDERGAAHAVGRAEDVPPANRDTVRVEPPSPEMRAAGWVFLADLRTPGADGRFAVRAVPSERFATELAQRSGLAAAMAAPQAPARPTTFPANLPPILAARPNAAPSAPGSPSVAPHGPFAPNAGAARPGGAAPNAAANGQPRVVLYGASWCSACHQAAEYFRANNIPFVEHDIEQEPDRAREVYARARDQGLPVGSIPIIDVGGRLMVGFSADAIQRALAGG